MLSCSEETFSARAQGGCGSDVLSETNIDENKGSPRIGPQVPGKEQQKLSNIGVQLLVWAGNYIQFSTAKGVRRK